MTATGPLADLRVLDISTIIAAPLAATLLADYGADVVKVEMPGQGDGMRSFSPFKDGVSLWWKVTNRGKRFIELDPRTEEGAAVFKRMVRDFDVVVENFRPGTLERWGLGPDVLMEIQSEPRPGSRHRLRAGRSVVQAPRLRAAVRGDVGSRASDRRG